MSSNEGSAMPPFLLPPTRQASKLRKQDATWAIEDFTADSSDDQEAPENPPKGEIETKLPESGSNHEDASSYITLLPHQPYSTSSLACEVHPSFTHHAVFTDCTLLNTTRNLSLCQDYYLKEIPVLHRDQANDCDVVDLTSTELLCLETDFTETKPQFDKCEMDVDLEVCKSEFRLSDDMDIVDSTSMRGAVFGCEVEVPPSKLTGAMECELAESFATFSVPLTSESDVQNHQQFSIPSETACVLMGNERHSIASVNVVDSSEKFNVYQKLHLVKNSHKFKIPPTEKEDRKVRSKGKFSIPETGSQSKHRNSFSIPKSGSTGWGRHSFSIPLNGSRGWVRKPSFSIPKSGSMGWGVKWFSIPLNGSRGWVRKPSFSVPKTGSMDKERNSYSIPKIGSRRWTKPSFSISDGLEIVIENDEEF